MIDWTQFRDLIWEGRWEAIVMMRDAMATNIMTHWWFGPILLVIAAIASRKAWLKLIRYVGLAYFRGQVNS